MVQKIFYKALFILIFWGSHVYAQLNQNGDFQLWFQEANTVKLSKKILFYLTEEIRYGDDASKAYFAYVEPRVEFLVSSSFSIAPGYRQASVFRAAQKRWFLEYCPLIDVFIKKTLHKWEIIDRNRFMYLIREGAFNSWVYRNRLYVLSPWKWGSIKLRPYFYDEVFFDQRRGFQQNRFSVGGRIDLSQKAYLSVGYILRHLKNGENLWIHHNILNLILNFSF